MRTCLRKERKKVSGLTWCFYSLFWTTSRRYHSLCRMYTSRLRASWEDDPENKNKILYIWQEGPDSYCCLVKCTNHSAVTGLQGQLGITGIIKCRITSAMLNIDISCFLFQHLLPALYCTSLQTPAGLICLAIQYFKQNLHKRAQSLINSLFYILLPDFLVLSNKVLNVMKDL